jgi:uncharacterized protein (DUF362 family)
MGDLKGRATVAIAKGEDPYTTTGKVLDLIRNMIDIEPAEKVLIKPNCVRPSKPTTGITTDSRVVEAIVEHLKDRGVSDITIAEGGNPGTERTFELTGLKSLSKRHGLRLVNINKDDWEEITIPNSRALGKVRISKTVLESDCIVNVPKLKIHHMGQVTLTLKNFMGVIVGNRGKLMHHRLDEKIVDLASLFKPRLNVVDGIIGAEMDEVVGRPVESNLILAGVDMVATDTVGSAVMGLDPGSIRHVQMAAKRGLGIGDLERIKVIGEPIESVRKPFSQDYSDEKIESYNLTRPLSSADIAQMKAEFEHRDPHLKDPYAET